MMANPIRALELHYPMIQFLIISNIPPAVFPANELNKQTNHMKKDLSCGSVLSLVWQRHLFTVAIKKIKQNYLNNNVGENINQGCFEPQQKLGHA